MTSVRRVALVTGGTRGIGLGVARALAAEGFDLALCGVREEAQVRDVVAELRGRGGEARYFRADVSSSGDRERLVAGVRAAFGRLHLLVNNAGVAPSVRADLLEAGEESFDRLLATNLKGPYFLTQAVARFMVEQKQQAGYEGAIVFVTSMSAEIASPNRGEYCVSKAGLSMCARLFAVRLAPLGIPVFEVRPGVIHTDMTAPVAEKYDRLIGEGLIPQGRWGEPEDVGRVVAALARGDAAYSTGAVIAVDGGLTIPRL
jgi:NAD(P)-dependent dehydrogenase (short-subunit alcohol dehydrogenase family)